VTPRDATDLRKLREARDRLVAAVGPERLPGLSQYLWDHASELGKGLDLSDTDLQPEEVRRVAIVLQGSHGPEEVGALALALDTAARATAEPIVELCWTGPRMQDHTRATGPLMEQMVHRAKRRVLIAEFDITTEAGAVLPLLEERLQAGVEVKVLLDKAGEKPWFMRWVRANPGVQVWDRPYDPNDPYSKFHVKCILVDGELGLFGSANLTNYGVRGNIELGVLVRDTELVGNAERVLLQFRSQMKHLTEE
jgi:phosphatidylserine/phosphatidylglycerophosphate/cardiolipin synthase-like enzyme